jgi:endogenous inhibitor of DNA gyrase (YacG/DUF329 family)
MSQPICAVCGKPATQTDKPFCSRRCADVDLHRWLKGAYAIPGGRAEDEEGEDAPQPSADDEDQ